MIGRTREYEKMFQLEGRLWWYRSLHERVDKAIQQQFGQRRDISILDVGCGTGGMLDFLRRRGYVMLRGLDGSVDAVAYCQQRELPVTLLNLNDLTRFEPETPYDVIICNDVFCYFTDTDLPVHLSSIAQRLKPGGILISNNNAFKVFGGQHDLAVGVIRRFTRADFDRLLPPAGLQIAYATYWSLIMALPILLMRQWQRLQLNLGWQTPETAQSDVYLPQIWVNETLYRIVRAEQTILRRTPFGSSLFMVIDSHWPVVADAANINSQ